MNSNILKISGLYTYPNPLSSTPEGALQKAANIVIASKNVAEPRRGFNALEGTLSSESYRGHKFSSYQSQILLNYATDKLAYYNTTSDLWVDYSGTYEAPDTLLAKMKFTRANSNIYFTTTNGVKKLDSYTNNVSSAGMVRAIDAELSLSGSSGFLADDTQVAYRVVWGIKDANKNLILGTPSGRAQIANSVGGSATRDVSVTCYIPSGVTTSHFFQVYRSHPSATADTEPNDELGLVYEANPTSGELIAGSVTFVDSTPESLIGADLYTNASQQGISQSNEEPPYCKDLALFKGSMFYVNIVRFQELVITLLAADGDNAIQSGDIITIAGTDYTATTDIAIDFVDGDVTPGTDTINEVGHNFFTGLKLQLTTTGTLPAGLALLTDYYVIKVDNDNFKLATSYADALNNIPVDITAAAGGGTHTATPIPEDTVTRTFQIYTAGTPSQDIADTARSLCRVVNQQSSATVYAYYISGYNELPGKILIRSRTFGSSEFSVTASDNGTAWNPQLPTSGTSVQSEAETHKNGIAVAKTGQAEAVPALNLLFSGTAADENRRVIALRDSLFILKDNDGVYRISGNSPSDFFVELFDASTRILAPETAQVLNNQIWCLSDQGVVAISDSGVEVKSLPIEDLLLNLFGAARDQVRSYSFAYSSETDRRYTLFVPEGLGDTSAKVGYSYSTATDSWTTIEREMTCGFVNPADDKIYLGDANSTNILQERKTYTNADFMDEAVGAFDILAYSGTTLTLNDVLNISIGDLVYQTDDTQSPITSINSFTNQVTVADTLTSWTISSVTVFKSFKCEVVWDHYVADQPGFQKHFSENQLMFEKNNFNIGFATYHSELSPSTEEISFDGSGAGQWGLFPWGERPWGGVSLPRPFRFYVPLEKQRCSQIYMGFKMQEAKGSFRLTGVIVRFNPMSTETMR